MQWKYDQKNKIFGKINVDGKVSKEEFNMN